MYADVSLTREMLARKQCVRGGVGVWTKPDHGSVHGVAAGGRAIVGGAVGGRSVQAPYVIVVCCQVGVQFCDLGRAVPHPGGDLVETDPTLRQYRGECVPHDVGRDDLWIQLSLGDQSLEPVLELPAVSGARPVGLLGGQNEPIWFPVED